MNVDSEIWTQRLVVIELLTKHWHGVNELWQVRSSKMMKRITVPAWTPHCVFVATNREGGGGCSWHPLTGNILQSSSPNLN